MPTPGLYADSTDQFVATLFPPGHPETEANPVRSTAEAVFNSSQFVSIDTVRLGEFVRTHSITKKSSWLHHAPLDISALSKHEKLHFILLLNSISFRYWGSPKWTVEHNGSQYNGAWGLVVALWKARLSGDLSLNPADWSTMSEDGFKQCMRGNILIPRFTDRLQIVRELGQVLCSLYASDFANFVRSNAISSMNLVFSLAATFSSFADTASFRGRRVYFYKRAQLLVADIIRTTYLGPELSHLTLHQLSACADYKLPWVLRRAGVLVYSPSLASRVDAGVPILQGSVEEVEIRANTIWAVELLTQSLVARGFHVNAIGVNDDLWLESQERTALDTPYHLTDTIYY